MADPENALPGATDGIYFAVPRRILEDELDWNLSDKKLSEQVPEPEPEQAVLSLRNDHSRLMDHFGPDVDEYLLRCSLDKFENHTVASFRKDVITQLSAAIENNSVRTPKESLNSSSSGEDISSEIPKKYSSIYKNSVSYSKQGRLVQKDGSACLPKTQVFFKPDDERDFTKQCPSEGFFFTKSAVNSPGKKSKLNSTTKTNLEVEGEISVSNDRRQVGKRCSQRDRTARIEDKVESLHQKRDSSEVDSGEEHQEGSDAKSAQEIEKGSWHNDDLAPECLQAFSKKIASISLTKSENELKNSTTKTNLEVEGEISVSNDRRQVGKRYSQRDRRTRIEDKVESLHQKRDSREVDSGEEHQEGSDAKSAQEIEKGSWHNDDLAPECLQAFSKEIVRSISLTKSENELTNSSEDIKTANENNGSICSKTTEKAQTDDLNSTRVLGSPEVEYRGDDSTESLCQRGDLSSLDDEKNFGANVSSVVSELQQNLEGEIEQVPCINYQGDDVGPTNLPKDFKLNSKEIEKTVDSSLVTNFRSVKQIQESGSDEIESKCEDAVPTLLKDLQFKSTDVISRRESRQISDSDLTSALEILKAKSSDILAKQNVFLHSMINELSSSAAESDCSHKNVSQAGENEEMEADKYEMKIGEETRKGGNESEVGNEEEREESKRGGDARQGGHETQVRNEDENEDKEEIWEKEKNVDVSEDEGKENARQIGNEAVIMSGDDRDKDKGKYPEKRREELRQSNNEAQEIKEGKRNDFKEMNDKVMRQIEARGRSTNEGKRDAPESDILSAAQQVADSCQTQTSDSDGENDQTSKDKGGTQPDSRASQHSGALPTVTSQGAHEGCADGKDEISEGATPKCLPRTSKSLPDKSSQSPVGQIQENYKFFREKSSRFSVSDVILEEEEVDALAKTSEAPRRETLAPTPTPRSKRCTEDASDVLIISVSDEDSNETIKTVVSVKKPDARRSPLQTLSGEPTPASPDPLDWAKFLSRDFSADPSNKDAGKVPEWDLGSTPESSSLWLSCSEDERQANLLNYDLFRTDFFSDADPDLQTHWPFTDSQPNNCLSVFHSECYALHL